MKKDEPFDPFITSDPTPEGIIFRSATRRDSKSISKLMAERNPSQKFEEIEASTNREIDRVELRNGYNLYLAELHNEVVGLCRFYNSNGLPAHKKLYPAPEGWYGMGILVSSKYRRQNIATFLSKKRIDVLRALGAKEFYSIVDSKNLTSIKMHQKFGYVEVARASGFMQVGFNEGVGCLLKLTI